MFVDVDCDPKTLGSASISCSSSSDSFDSFDCFIALASSGTSKSSFLGSGPTSAQDAHYLSQIQHLLRQSPMVNLLQQPSHTKETAFISCFIAQSSALNVDQGGLSFSIILIKGGRISTMSQEAKQEKAVPQSIAGISVTMQQSFNTAQPPLLHQSYEGVTAHLQLAVTSEEQLITLAIMQKDCFPTIAFLVEIQAHSHDGEAPQIRILFQASELDFESIQALFWKMGLAISKRQPAEVPVVKVVKLADYFRNAIFGEGKHAMLDAGLLKDDVRQRLGNQSQLFGDKTLSTQRIAQNTYIITNNAQAKCNHDSSSVTLDFPSITPLSHDRVYFQINSTKDSQKIDFKNERLIDYLEGDQVLDIRVCLIFQQTLSIFMEVTFTTQDALKDFLVQNYDVLKRVTKFNIGNHQMKQVKRYSELPLLFCQLGKRMRYVGECLGLLENEAQTLPQDNKQSRPSHISGSIYQQMKHRLEHGGDLLCLEPFWGHFLIEDLCQAYTNWEVVKGELGPILIPLFSILKHRVKNDRELFIQGSSLYESTYPGITAIVDLFDSKLKLPPPKTTACKQSQLDELLRIFIKQRQFLSKNQGIAVICPNKYGVPAKELIGGCEAYRNMSHRWTDVFNCVTLGLKRSKHAPQKVADLVRNMDVCRYPSLECLGCSKFFYYNYTNIASPSKRVPVKLFPSAEKMSDYETQILEAICYMLNNSGGVILFNCAQEYKQVLPKGSLMSEKEKESIENKLVYMLGSVFPKPEIGLNIKISFVPLAVHPLASSFPKGMESYRGEEQRKPLQYFCKTVYLEGYFVTRIKVCPTDTSRVYLHSNGNQYLLHGIRGQGSGASVRRLGAAIKQKVGRCARDRKRAFKQQTFGSPLNHQCQQPDSGVILDSKNMGRIELERNENEQLEDQFPHMSMLICKPKYLKVIKERLEGRGVKCEVLTRFSNYKQLKSTNNTAILYHDCKFEDLLRYLKTGDFSFEEKRVVAVYVTQFVRIEQGSGFSDSDIRTASEWLRIEFPHETLRLFQNHSARRPEHYLATDSKLSTLFIYFVFKSSGMKVELKNPEMEEGRRREVFREVPYQGNNRESLEEELKQGQLVES